MHNNTSYEPSISVGILLNQTKIEFILHNDFIINNKSTIPQGQYIANISNGYISLNGNEYDYIELVSKNDSKAEFTIKDVIIGVDFHWEQKENQRFIGDLKLIVEYDKLTAINVLLLEDYLISVISSEMSATSYIELLKAHAIISRSWLIAQIEKNKQIDISKYKTHFENEDETIKWFDREDHINFDVCADDHCQRYQGITRQTTDIVKKVINETKGEVIIHDNKICDTRFSKCCGGMMETFENVWEPIAHPYLQGKLDLMIDNITIPDLTNENQAETWIRSSPKAFCNTNKNILKQILNDYDQKTVDFYRWQVEYTQEEISSLIRDRSGIDYGTIIDLVPIERGTSGRIIRLMIVGIKRQRIIGKELEIRRTLSKSHLYSSAFVIDKVDMDYAGVPTKFILTGAGWGHGVGLCQVGAAVMANEGYDYKTILKHYFPNSDIMHRY